ncbi:MAG TPA: ChaN family lipoprotein [Paracoccaceae bacterium]|nr:ChaN family lipoprotein [Paracoccaceae bacterium]
MVRLLALLALAAGPLIAGPIAPEGLGALPPADVVILGEVHDNAAHHAHQAQAVAAIRPTALVFEMLTPAQAARAEGVDRLDAAALGAALGWDGSGWPDFALYHPIFAAAPGAAIFGGGMDRAEVRRAFSEPPEVIFGQEAAAFGLTQPLDPADQAAREAAQQAAHCNALPPEMLPGFVAAQRLRDAALARAVRDALVVTGGPVVLIAGTEHARKDVGVPAKLARLAGMTVLSVGQVEGDPGPDAPFDLWIVTPPAPRDDPCAGFTAPRAAP